MSWYVDKMWFLRICLLDRFPLAAKPEICITGKRQSCNRACTLFQTYGTGSLSIGVMSHKCNTILFFGSSPSVSGSITPSDFTQPSQVVCCVNGACLFHTFRDHTIKPFFLI